MAACNLGHMIHTSHSKQGHSWNKINFYIVYPDASWKSTLITPFIKQWKILVTFELLTMAIIVLHLARKQKFNVCFYLSIFINFGQITNIDASSTAAIWIFFVNQLFDSNWKHLTLSFHIWLAECLRSTKIKIWNKNQSQYYHNGLHFNERLMNFFLLKSWFRLNLFGNLRGFDKQSVFYKYSE